MKLSKSSINTYLMCQRRFQYEYIDLLPKPEPERGSPLDIGSTVHNIFEQFVKDYDNSEIKAMSYKDIYKICMQYERAEEFKLHVSNFARFMARCFKNGYIIFTAEFYIHNLKYDLSGLADLVLIKDDYLVCIDYKTGATGGINKYRLELAYYVVLLEEKFNMKVRYVGIFFTKGNDFRVAKVRGKLRKGTVISDNDIKAALDLIDVINKRVDEGKLYPNSGYHCRFCDFQKKCIEDGGR